MPEIKNILTVDLEDWFVVEALSGRYNYDDWSTLPSAVVRNSHKLLELLDRKRVKATWFVLGWVADKYPELIQEIFSRGHEVATHSYYHRRVDLMTPDVFRKDTELAIDAIVRAIGNRPHGYRAPSWSINPSVPWAFEILADLGFLYDSSVFPIKHDLYGWPDGPRLLFQMEFDTGRTMYELPASTYRFFGKNIPVGGGGYFRHSPYWYSRRVIRRLNANGQPTVFYIHPWEMDSSLPHIEGLSMVQKFRTYSSTAILNYKIEKLLTDFTFTTASEYLKLFKKKRIGFE